MRYEIKLTQRFRNFHNAEVMRCIENLVFSRAVSIACRSTVSFSNIRGGSSTLDSSTCISCSSTTPCNAYDVLTVDLLRHALQMSPPSTNLLRYRCRSHLRHRGRRRHKLHVSDSDGAEQFLQRSVAKSTTAFT